jgi:putative FmdB family regulatory protein
MLYDYICVSCGKIKEVNHKMSESPTIKCDCGSLMKIKIGKVAGIHFKGDGFTKAIREN